MEIGIWGDSITYGACDSEALGWVGRLRKSFGTEDHIGVYNFGICGDTTDDLLKRFSIEADALHPDIIVFAIGINDSKYPTGKTESIVPLEKYKQNMRELIALARKHNNNVSIIGSTKVNEALIRDSGTRFVNDVIKTYNDFLKEFAESEELIYIDVFGVLDIHTDLGDGLHPNAQGYEKLFRAIREFVK